MRLLKGTDELRPSNNPWDCLGPGIYFWEQNPYRALTYAEEAACIHQKFSGRISAGLSRKESPFMKEPILLPGCPADRRFQPLLESP